MHAYIMVRGVKHEFDKFITTLQGKFLSYQNELGKDKVTVQLSVRPIQLFEIVFPEEHLQTVMHTLFDETTRGDNLTYAKRNKKYLWAMRKALNAKPFPELDKTSLPLPVWKHNIEVAGIGIKKDDFKDGIEHL